MSPVRVGLDFGTSNSGVAVYNGSQLSLLPVDRKNILPEVVKSVIYITRDAKQYIGQEAIETYYRDNINRPRRFVKKYVGEIEVRHGDMFFVRDVYIEVDELTPGRLIQYIKTGLRSQGYEGTRVFDQFFSLKEIIELYLCNLKERAEQILGEKIYGVTLGRPVKFFDNPTLDQQAQDTLQQAALDAGFNEVAFELEPIAAALFYETTLQRPENVLIFDFGGGTLDITIMRLGDRQQRQVYASGGIGIAGSDFDRLIIQKQMLEHFGKGKFADEPRIESLIDALADWQTIPQLSTPQVHSMLQRAMLKSQYNTRLKALETIIYNDLAFAFYNKVEASKIALSDQGAVLFRLEEKDIHIWELLTRFRFEQEISELAQKIEQCLADTVATSGLDPQQIDATIKTGGSSGIPYFNAMLERWFGRRRVKASSTFSSVTAGLAIRAYEGVA